MKAIPFYHVDVFSPEPLSGNGLIVYTEAAGFSDATMQALTQEMRQFESIFLQEIRDNTVTARIFTCEEELDFAGHPILGAAATLHDLLAPDKHEAEWTFVMRKKTVKVTTAKKGDHYEAIMNQGKAEFGRVLNETETASILGYLRARPGDLYPGLFPTVVSTGLPYLIVPFQNNRWQASFGAPGLEERLHEVGAKFIGLLDIETRSIRTGNNDGSLEDIATGSLAGPAGAFLVEHGFEKEGGIIRLNQGKNLGRDSQLFVRLQSFEKERADVLVSGEVCKIAQGSLDGGLVRRLP
jgi:trans-2,3-dihydro-3-hydroxyanthranilate isomerase